MAKDKLNKDITIEFANQPPSISDVADFEIMLFARSLLWAYKKHQDKQEKEKNNEIK